MSITIATATTILRKPVEDLYAKAKEKVVFTIDNYNHEKNIKKIAQKTIIFDKVRTIWQKSKDIRLSDMYYPPKILLKDEEEVVAEIDSLEQLPRHQNFVLEGTVGQGKSIFLRYLCLQELSSKSTGRIPILIELRTIEKYESLEKAIKNNLSNLGFNLDDDMYQFYLESGKIVLLLDAFDELPSKYITSVMEELESLCVRFTELQIIATSRPDRDIQKSVRFNIIKICPLTQDDFEPFLKRIGVPLSLRNGLIQSLTTESKKIASLLKTPLMLTLAAYVYRSEREIPAELPNFFEVLFQTVFTAHDKSKIAFNRECKSGLDEGNLQRLFETFCYLSMQDNNLRSLKSDAFEKAYKKAQAYTKETCKLSEFKHDIVEVACLMQTEGYDTTFIHLSIQEYYAASFIKNCISDVAKKFYETVLTHYDDKWLQVLGFLKHIDEYRWSKYYRLPMISEALFKIKNASNFCEELLSNSSLFMGNELSSFEDGPIAGFTKTYNDNKVLEKIGETILFEIVGEVHKNRKILKDLPGSPVRSSEKNQFMYGEFEKEFKIVDIIAHSTEIQKVSNKKKLFFIDSINQEKEALEKIVNMEESKIEIIEIP